MNGAVLAASYTVPGALLCVVADGRTDERQRIVAEKNLSGLHEFMFLE